MICPYNNKLIEDFAVYIRVNSKKLNISAKELRFLVIKYNYPKFCDKDFFEKHYINLQWSLPDFQKYTGFNYEQTKFLLNYFNISCRGGKEGCKIATKKRVETCIKKYGVKNPSQVESVKEKKRQTFIKNYGMDNIWKTQEFKDNLDKFYLEKYGIDFNDFQIGRSKKVWDNKTIEEKQKWLDKSILSDDGYKNRGNNRVNCSKMEDEISSLLDDLMVPHFRCFHIKNNKKNYYYDICIPILSLIIEINGDYWHANPKKYKSEDIINYPNGKFSAKQIWEKDAKKNKVAEDNEYKIIYLWEDETRQKTKLELKLLIEEKIKSLI